MNLNSIFKEMLHDFWMHVSTVRVLQFVRFYFLSSHLTCYVLQVATAGAYKDFQILAYYSEGTQMQLYVMIRTTVSEMLANLKINSIL